MVAEGRQVALTFKVLMNCSQPFFRHDHTDVDCRPIIPVGDQCHAAGNAIRDLQLRQTLSDCSQSLMNRIVFHKESAGRPNGRFTSTLHHGVECVHTV